MPSGGLKKFIKASRVKFTATATSIRNVHVSDLVYTTDENKRLSHYLANRAPLLYRDASAIAEDLEDGFFLTAIRDTLLKLPTSEAFRQSHFAELLASTFAEEILGLRRIHSKLTLLTAENANAYKIDLLMYKPNTLPVELVFGEVKSSHKCAADGLPANHDKSCFADLFNSAREYTNGDYEFDLVAAKDNLKNIKEPDRTRIRNALKPSGNMTVGFAGLIIIDYETKSDKETPVLATRKSTKSFDVDLLCVEKINDTTKSMFLFLEKLKEMSSEE